jgi:hypothetical protein
VRLDDVVLRSLEKEPDRRYQHASQVKDEVAGITATPGGVPPPLPAVPTGKPRSNAHKWIIAGSLVGCLMLLVIPAGLLAFFVMPASRYEAAKASELAYLSPAADKAASTARANAFLVATRESLTIDPSIAEELGIPADRLPALNSQLERAWAGYLDWEKHAVELRWLSPDVLEAKIAPEAPRPDEYLSEAREAIERATVRSDMPNSGYQRLVQFIEQQMFFTGDPWTRHEISIRGEIGNLKSIRYRSPTANEGSSGRSGKPTAMMRRLWSRASAERDAQPK